MQGLTNWLNKSVKTVLCLWAVLLPGWLTAQSPRRLTLDSAYALARANYPMIQQKQLVARTASLTIENLNKGWLPQFSINGQATYQSDVTKVEVPIPGITINPLSKDQYKIVADMNQVIYDGGVIKQQKTMQALNAKVEDQQVEVALHQLKDRINQIYLGILYLDQQIKQVELVKSDLQIGVQKVQAQVANGVAFKSNLSALQAELLKTDQRGIELKASRKGMIEALGLFVNEPLDATTVLQTPDVAPPADTVLQRPELALYADQSKLLQHQDKLINAKNLPKASLFVQGGYGRPGLNMLKDQFDWFYIGGLRLNWSLGGLYTSKREKEIVSINRQMVDVQQSTFLLNTRAQLTQQQSDIDKLRQLIATDQSIIDLRQQVKEAAKAQLDNAVITTNDYLQEVNAEDQARQALITHRIQLLEAEINYQTLLGK